MAEDEQPRSKYWAFISYSSKDRKWGEWLIAALERYRVPKSLVGLKTRCGVVPPRLYPVFRDRDELRVGSDVGDELRKSLLGSRYLVVICSPNSANPHSWVTREITSFKAAGREDDVLALIVDGEPNASARPGEESLECFPAPLRHRFDEHGRETTLLADPLAADIRREDDRPRSARRKALLKLIARIIDVDFDTLEQRDRRRRRQRRLAWSAAGAVLLSVLVVLVVLGRHETLSALSQQLAKQARAESSSQPDLALLLSVLAYHVAPTPAAFESILSTIWPRQNLVAYLHHRTKVTLVAFAPDERSLAVASCVPSSCDRSTVTRYDLQTRRVLGASISVSGEVKDMLYQAPVGTLLILRKGPEGDELVAVDPSAPSIAPSPRYRSSDPITSVQVSEDGHLYGIGMKSGEFKVFDGFGRRCGGFVRGAVSAMAFSADSGKFAAVSEAETTVIALAAPECPARREPTGDRVASVAFEPSANELYVVFLDGTVDRWRLGNTTGGSDRFSFVPAERFVHALDRQARYLASQHMDHVRIYDLSARRTIEKEIQETGGSESIVARDALRQALQQVEVDRFRDVDAKRIVFSSSGKLVATIDANGQVIVWSTAGQPIVERSASDQEPSSNTSEAISPDGRLRVEAQESTEGCGTDAKNLCQKWTELRLVERVSAREITVLRGPRQRFRMSGPLSVAFQRDGNVVVQGPRWREVWQVAPDRLMARACGMANRDLSETEIKRYVGWRKLILQTVRPCEERTAARAAAQSGTPSEAGPGK